MWKLTKKADPSHGMRVESFGAIVQLARPRALVFVDRDYARNLGASGGGRWTDPNDDGAVGRKPLSAPLEAHLQLTNQCDAGCRGCYTGATPNGSPQEWGLSEWKRAVDSLAKSGVFHLALGGGESATLPWLGELARYARQRGLIPNLTTSGLAGMSQLLPIAELFGQINISLDGLGTNYAEVRGFDGFAQADQSLRRLRKTKREVGINVVITQRSFGQIDQLFAYARKLRLNEVELLRFKPSGRGVNTFADTTCSDEQHRQLLPTVLAASRRHRMRARLDCSFTPMIAHHEPGPALLAKLSVYGCTGGDFLVAATATGALTACSFAAPPTELPEVHEIADYWRQPTAFGAFRDWRQAAEPCRSCDYHELCRGGCKVVSAHLCGDPSAPDPECPKVVAARSKTNCPGHRSPFVVM